MINASYGDQNCKIIPDNMIKKIKKILTYLLIDWATPSCLPGYPV